MNIDLCNEAFPFFKPLSHVHAISCSQQRGARITTQYQWRNKDEGCRGAVFALAHR